MTELDHFDIAILSLLQKNNSIPQKDIGEQIGLSPAAVQRRIKKLTEKAFIQANISVLDRHKLGQPLTLFVEVSLENEKIEYIDQAKSIFKNHPAVQQCYYVTGEADFILIIIVPSMQAYEQLTREIFFSNSNIKEFKTFVTMDIVKLGLSIPV
ncbi:Lrp/AsnC family transcriptional regulator [Polluticaenibacter yanchengensis]|uniref:Lrp/AsnC family transcriptional regulator n=1 Tax=Polluticaenibacter yanchengensis TaxID=3014562 RepID=A0ABT4UL76_9BACT|nr:Lrp/AsnC family transcriptional regulator [Chitinophagaceae bacterium LY-5]